MASRLYMATELLYGTGLLTIITAVPDILIKLPDSIDAVSVTKLGINMIAALLLTALAMFPTVITLPKFLTRRLRCHFLALVPWILIYCFQFLSSIKNFVFAIKQVSRFNNPITALIVNCSIFGKAFELILHWIATCHLRTNGIPFEIR